MGRQTSSIFVAGVLDLQLSRKFRRRGDSKTRFRHFGIACATTHPRISRIEIKYLQERNVGQHVDHYPGYTIPVNNRCKAASCCAKDVRTLAWFGRLFLDPKMSLLFGRRNLKVAVYHDQWGLLRRPRRLSTREALNQSY